MGSQRFASDSKHRGKQPAGQCWGFGGKAPHSILPQSGYRVQNHDHEQFKWLPRLSLTNSAVRLCRSARKNEQKMDDFRNFHDFRNFVCQHFPTVDILASRHFQTERCEFESRGSYIN